MNETLNALGTTAWRPILTWILILALIINFILAPILGGFGIDIPSLDIEELVTTLGTLGALAGFRTVEKIKKVDTKNIIIKGLKNGISE